METEEFDALFDNGGDITPYLNMKTARRPNWDPKRVNVDFPTWMVTSLDWEAKRLGVTRQALIKLWISDRLEKHHAK